MKHSKTKGLVMIGSLRSAGLTTYMRQGKVVTRVAQSDERRSNTLAQFRQRQRMRHTLALWTTLRQCEPTFTQRATAYTNFMSLANRLPVVYVVRPLMEQASFLMPGLPVSDGVLPSVGQELAVVDGEAALVTSMRAGDADTGAELWLYCGEQRDEGPAPRVWFSKRRVSWLELSLVEGRYVLKDEAFADDMRGWALVMVKGGRCSSQGLVTRCRLYERFTTEEALRASAESYGGLTE